MAAAQSVETGPHSRCVAGVRLLTRRQASDTPARRAGRPGGRGGRARRGEAAGRGRGAPAPPG